MSAPRTRQHAAPQSPLGRLPPRLGGRPASETAPAAGLEAALSRLAVHLVLGSCRRLVATSPAQRLRRSSEVGANRVCIANRLAPGTLHLGVPRRHRDLSRVAPGAVIRLAFDRPIDGVATAAAPAACVAVTPPAFEAVHRRPASTDVLPPPIFPSALAPRPSQALRVLERRFAAGFARPALTRNSLQPCNALRRYALRRSRLTPRTGSRRVRPGVPNPRTKTGRKHDDSHR